MTASRPGRGGFAHARSIAPPTARREPVRTTLHGRARIDDYAWLRDDNWREVMRDPDVLRADIRAHLDAENAYAEAVMAPSMALRQTLFQEMRGRIKEDEAEPPLPDGPHRYYSRYREGGQYPIFARQPRDGGSEQILLDGDTEAGEADFFDLGDVLHSPDHRYLGWCSDRLGSEYYGLAIRDLESGKDVTRLTAESAGDFVWANDSRTVFWVWRDAQNRPARVYRRRIDASEDELVYEESDPGFFVSLGVTDARGFVVINAHDHTTSELRLIDASRPDQAPRLVAARRAGVEYDLIEADDRFYVLTNADGAIDFKIAEAPKDAPGPENWRDVIPARPGIYVLDVIGFKNWQVRLERENAAPRIVVRRYQDGAEHVLPFEDVACALGVSDGYEYDTDILRVSHESPARPEETYDYDMAARRRTLLQTQDVPSGHDPSDYRVERLTALAPDGETVPITLLSRKDQHGPGPLLLYGYGAYGHVVPASFRISPLSLVDRGMRFAIAHVRGGTEKGYGWYLDGKLGRKTNTFDDFIAAGRALIEQGRAAPGGIVAMGGSAGGMLVGAAVNRAPDLFAGAVAQVPFVDVLNTMCDAELPLTPPEWPEWGDPTRDPAAYDAIAAYSPYDNVKPKAYPHILATAGLTDPRVTYWEPAKWVARLRATRSDDGVTLLKTEMGAGHGGKSGRFDSLHDTAFEYAFALTCAGLA